MNVGKLVTKSAEAFPDSPAVVHGDKKLTYAEFNARVNRLANALTELGVRQGDHVAVLMYNYPQMLEAIFACFKLGCGSVPINFRLHPNEFAFIMDHSEAKAAVISPEFNEAVHGIRERIPRVGQVISTEGASDGFLDYESLIQGNSERFRERDVEPDDTAWLFYTSGTTGLPKGAMLTHRNLLAMTMNFYADIRPGMTPQDAALHAAPLSHGSGLYALPNFGKAALNVILDSKSFEPELVCRTIEQYRITNMFAAPTMIRLLLDHPAVEKYDLGSLKALNYGGAPMLVKDLTEAVKKLGPCLVQLFGQAESPMTITYLPQWAHVIDGASDQAARLGSAGIQRTDVEVAIFDDQDRELPRGETGEIVTRSDLVMKGYWRNPEATADALRNGWLHTGDMGYMDENGYLFIMDRSKDMIITGGENVYPREIEEVIIRHPSVREVAVIGVPDEKWGEAIKAVVSLNKGASLTEAELIEYCRNNIAGYKKPKSLEIVDDLPKNNYGKILKRELRSKYWEGKDRKVI
jgi:acyl-CoA synthetase (AMP-forming)/AMP-acid ligase II